MTDSKKKCRLYSQEYLKYGFVTSTTSEYVPMCLLCDKTLSNDAMKPAKMKDHLERMHSDKKNKNYEYFLIIKEKLKYKPRLNAYFKPSASLDKEEGLRVSYKISLNIAKKGKPYITGEDIILAAIKDVIENIFKKDFEVVLKYIPLSAKTVQRRIEEMADDIERTLVSELQHSKFALQVDESTFENATLLMAYLRFHSPSLKTTVDEFLFAQYLKTDSNTETIFLCLQNYFNKHGIPIENITAVATDGAPAMVGRYRGFLAYIKNVVPIVQTVHCILHGQHLVA